MLLAALALFLDLSPSARPLRNVVFDGYQRLSPLERESHPVTVVLIDEQALHRHGQWPWPRTKIAELVTRISGYQPAAIGIDLLFPEPDRFSPATVAEEMPIISPALAKALAALPSNDERFAEAIRGRKVVLGIASFREPDARFQDPPRAAPIILAGNLHKHLRVMPGYIRSVAVIDEAAAGRGLIGSAPADEDQVVRSVPLFERVQGVAVPTIGLEVLRVATGSGFRIEDAPGGLLTVRFSGVAATFQDDGTEWVRFSRYDRGRDVSADDVMAGKVDPDRLRSKVVLVGISGLGLLDYKTTPLGEFIPGVAVHAQVVENIYNGVTLVRPDYANRVEVAALIFCGLVLVVLVPRLTALKAIHLAFALVLMLFAAAFIAFQYFHMLFDFAWPAIGTLAVFTTAVVGTLSEAERQRRQLRDEAAHMAGEVDAARRIQMGLLPDPHEVLANDRRFRIAALLEPARTVGGDFYDCFMIDADRLFFVVADVSGKGLGAALFMASVKSHLKSVALQGGAVGDVLTHAQRDIARENPEQLFVTAFAGILDVARGELEYSNAGHEPPFVRTPRGAPDRIVGGGGPPLCVVDDFVYPTERRQLGVGEWICVFTDGATESMNPDRKFFGTERLRTTLSWMPEGIGPDDLVQRLREDIARFAGGAEPADDITLLVLKWSGGKA